MSSHELAGSDPGSSHNSLELPSLQPLSHEHPLLAADEFDADGFLLSRLHIPLEELRGELREYLGVLREELVQLINDDYEEFISLGTGLRGENSRLASLQAPLSALIDQVQNVRISLDSHQSDIAAKLAARAELREERVHQAIFDNKGHPAKVLQAMLSMINRMIETVTRAELLWTTRNTGDKSKIIARVASEYNQILYLARKAEAEHCKIVKTLETRIAKIKSDISQELAGLLVKSVEEGTASAIRHTLSTYSAIEGWRDAEEAVRRRFRQKCRQIITADALLQPSSPAVPITPHHPSNPFDGLRRIRSETPLAALLNRVLGEVDIYRTLVEAAAAESDDFDFFASALWPEIAAAIVDNLGGSIFAAGRPDELHQSYVTVHEFIALYEEMAPTQQAVDQLRATSSFETLERRWQLPVYYQLRWKEIVAKLESDLSRQDQTVDWLLPQSAAVWTAIETCWSDKVFLVELAPRFWRLSLQIFSRYKGLVRRLLEDEMPKGEEDTAREDSALRLAARIIVDADRMTGKLRGFGPFDNNEPAIQAAFQVDTAWYEEQLVGLLAKRCGEGLKLVRSVSSQFRTATPAVSNGVKPSYFIPTIFKPLQQIFEQQPELRQKYAATWSRKVADEVFSGYASILASVRKTEDLLRRHRKSKKTTFSLFGSSGPSAAEAELEDDRFRQQMLADTAALAEEVKAFGVDVAELPGWVESQDVINKPAE